VSGARHRLTVVTPFYSEEGVTHVLDHLGDTAFVAVTTRLSPPDWLAGVADPEALADLLDLLPGRHSLGIIRNLHAKAYVGDRDHALVGSANLSEGGFIRNIELMVRFRGSEAADALDVVERACAGSRPMDLPALQRWIADSKPAIDDARTVTTEAAEQLAPAQEALDTVLGYGRSTRTLPDPRQIELDDFIDWARGHAALAGADMIVRRHDNADGQNLQGHVKQSFYAVTRFLNERPDMRGPLAGALAAMDPDDVYQLEAAVAEAWNQHVDDHATDASSDGTTWSYSILRGLMPPALGGTREGGGGGSPTLKRVLPLVARYMNDRGL
jgi:hypothetical protein